MPARTIRPDDPAHRLGAWPPSQQPDVGLSNPTRFEAVSFQPVTKADLEQIAGRMMQNFSGQFITLGQEPNLPWCGMLEFALLSVLVLDHRVDRIRARPERVSLIVDNKKVSRIPAFQLDCGPLRVTVDAASWSQSKTVNDALARAYANRGERYKVFSRAELEAQPRLRNARMVLGFRRHRPSPDTELAVLRNLSLPGKHTVHSLQQAIPNHPDTRETVYSFCTRRRVTIDLWADNPRDMQIQLLPAQRWLP